MIVTATRAIKSIYIIASNVSSTIRLTSSYVGGKPHLLILIPYINNIYHICQKIKQNLSTFFAKKRTIYLIGKLFSFFLYDYRACSFFKDMDVK